MALETYRKKRDFAATPEPRGGTFGQAGNSFVIQKHDATRLHYDFRLEMDGALKSWAVTKGPSLIPGEKRLAVHVEDHPLEYGDFEGTIPKGEYGGGTVIVWDRGTWTPIHDPHKGYAKGHLEFALHGEKLGGRWHLVRMHGKPREKRENWLLIKGEDEAARSGKRAGYSDRTSGVGEDGAADRRCRRTRNRAGPPRPERSGRRAPAGRRQAGHSGEQDSTSSRPDPSKIKGAKRAPLPTFLEPMRRRWCPRRPRVSAGSMRSSLTAIACRPVSRPAGSSC